MRNILLHSIISYKIWRKWSISKKITWNWLPKNYNQEKPLDKDKQRLNNNARPIAELSKPKLKNIFKKNNSYKTKYKASKIAFGKIFKIKMTEFRTQLAVISNTDKRKIRLKNRKRPSNNSKRDMTRPQGIISSWLNFLASMRLIHKLAPKWKNFYKRIRGTNTLKSLILRKRIN